MQEESLSLQRTGGPVLLRTPATKHTEGREYATIRVYDLHKLFRTALMLGTEV